MFRVSHLPIFRNFQPKQKPQREKTDIKGHIPTYVNERNV